MSYYTLERDDNAGLGGRTQRRRDSGAAESCHDTGFQFEVALNLRGADSPLAHCESLGNSYDVQKLTAGAASTSQQLEFCIRPLLQLAPGLERGEGWIPGRRRVSRARGVRRARHAPRSCRR